ncbi:MAG: hypothetical protein GF411_16985 [Candidatus Lokiarchaeota archaeon]|nr:hypothetical protein [Candidatus Lokiarchaeota archaeon]
MREIALRLLMFHVENFWYNPHNPQNPDIRNERLAFDESILVWIQAEEKDEEERTKVLRKMVKNIRWLSKKLNCNSIILHSFAHLGDSKSSPEFADEVIEETMKRLVDRDYKVHIVPFGIFNEFQMHVKGPSLAKVFKQF